MKPHYIEKFDNFINTLLTVPKILLMSRIGLGKPVPISANNEAFILANGPSLKDFLLNHIKLLDGKTIFCVNNFVRTDAFPQVKPHYYVLAATNFWQKEEKPGWHEERMLIFKEIADKTSWPMILLVPQMAEKKSAWRKELEANSHIRIAYFNNTPIEGFPSFIRFCMNRGWGMPRPHNVLVATLSLVLMMQYQEIYITGADHSWMKEVFVTEENRVFLSQKHFYDKQFQTPTYTSEARPMYAGSSTRERKLHEILEKWYYSFRSYWQLKDYAHSIGSKVVNVTPNSYIDAFDRRTLNELKVDDQSATTKTS